MAKPKYFEITKKSLIELGDFFRDFVQNYQNQSITPENELQFNLQNHLQQAKHHNSWFTESEILFCFNSWAEALTKQHIERWLAPYKFEFISPKRVGLVLAGNVPLVGLHDVICVLLSGHTVVAKYSSKDPLLLPWIKQFLVSQDASFENRLQLTKDRLTNFDAVIATGSNNTARYFEYYFRNKPRIIRKNRNSLAILTGNETELDFKNLAEDVFRYFGLGCRNVSKLMVPKEYNFNSFFEGIYHRQDLLQHHTYVNNYDYNKAVYLMSSIQLLDNGFLILKEDSGLASPIGTLFYEYYEDEIQLKQWLVGQKEKLQCVVGNKKNLTTVDTAFGNTQHPALWDYADGVDTLSFLLQLK